MNPQLQYQHQFCEKCMHINQCHPRGLIYHLSKEILVFEEECPDFARSKKHLKKKRRDNEEKLSREGILGASLFVVLSVYVSIILILESIISFYYLWLVLFIFFTLVALCAMGLLVASYIRLKKRYDFSSKTKRPRAPYRRQINKAGLALPEHIEQR